MGNPMASEPADFEVRRREKLALQDEIRTRREAALVVNTRSRRGRRLYATAKRLLEEGGFTLAASYPVFDPSRLPEIVETLVGEGHKLIIVGGGDGTVSSIVDFLAYRKAVLAILPLGTANSFARTLGIPLNVEGAVEVICSGKVADVDLGEIDGDFFANSAALGISADIARSRPQRLKRYLGRFAYLLVAARRFLYHRSFRCVLTSASGSLEISALDVLIANGPYHGGVLVVGAADVESRDLVVRVIKGRSKWILARGWLRILFGRALAPETLVVMRARAVAVAADPPQYVCVDGEVVTRTPMHVRVAPDALKIMVPGEFADRS
jgi:YegS/Rv2252/BmrU family lipid kinase